MVFRIFRIFCKIIAKITVLQWRCFIFITRLCFNSIWNYFFPKQPFAGWQINVRNLPPQNFSLPNSTVFYMAKKQCIDRKSSNVYLKLAQACKYFFVQNPILIVSELHYSDGPDNNKSWTLVSNKGFPKINQIINNFSVSLLLSTLKRKKKVNVKSIDRKMFITDSISIKPKTDVSAAASIIDKVMCNPFIKVELENQTLFLNEFLKIAKSVSFLSMKKVQIQDDLNGSVLPLEVIIGNLPSLKFFYYVCDQNTEIDVQSLIQIPHFRNIEVFNLFNVDSFFDIQLMFAYIKTNQLTSFKFEFSDGITEDFIQRLDAIMDEIIKTEFHQYSIPLLISRTVDLEKLATVLVLHIKQFEYKTNRFLSPNHIDQWN